MGHDEIFKTLNSKENHEQYRRQPSVWEKIFANKAADKGLISKICKEFMKLNIKKQINKQTIFPTQGSNSGLLHCRQILCHMSYQESLKDV